MANASLDAEQILETLEILQRRIRERFPTKHLAAFSQDVVEIALNVQARSEPLSRPIVSLRIAVAAVIAGIVSVLLYGLAHVRDVLADPT
jgi:hypothetical protein